jgi:hypothetical protein
MNSQIVSDEKTRFAPGFLVAAAALVLWPAMCEGKGKFIAF